MAETSQHADKFKARPPAADRGLQRADEQRRARLQRRLKQLSKSGDLALDDDEKEAAGAGASTNATAGLYPLDVQEMGSTHHSYVRSVIDGAYIHFLAGDVAQATQLLNSATIDSSVLTAALLACESDVVDAPRVCKVLEIRAAGVCSLVIDHATVEDTPDSLNAMLLAQYAASDLDGICQDLLALPGTAAAVQPLLEATAESLKVLTGALASRFEDVPVGSTLWVDYTVALSRVAKLAPAAYAACMSARLPVFQAQLAACATSGDVKLATCACICLAPLIRACAQYAPDALVTAGLEATLWPLLDLNWGREMIDFAGTGAEAVLAILEASSVVGVAMSDYPTLLQRCRWTAVRWLVEGIAGVDAPGDRTGLVSHDHVDAYLALCRMAMLDDSAGFAEETRWLFNRHPCMRSLPLVTIVLLYVCLRAPESGMQPDVPAALLGNILRAAIGPCRDLLEAHLHADVPGQGSIAWVPTLVTRFFSAFHMHAVHMPVLLALLDPVIALCEIHDAQCRPQSLLAAACVPKLLQWAEMHGTLLYELRADPAASRWACEMPHVAAAAHRLLEISARRNPSSPLECVQQMKQRLDESLTIYAPDAANNMRMAQFIEAVCPGLSG